MACCPTSTLNLFCPIVVPSIHNRTAIRSSFLYPQSKPRNLCLASKTRVSATFSPTPLVLKHSNNPFSNLTFPCNNKKTHMVQATNLNLLTGIGTGTFNVPVTYLAAGIAKWLDLYIRVLTVRLLLSWYPNIPWDKQPFSAFRSLCDPYLYLFRSLVPSAGTLDYSSIIGVMILSKVSEILNTIK